MAWLLPVLHHPTLLPAPYSASASQRNCWKSKMQCRKVLRKMKKNTLNVLIWELERLSIVGTAGTGSIPSTIWSPEHWLSSETRVSIKYHWVWPKYSTLQNNTKCLKLEIGIKVLELWQTTWVKKTKTQESSQKNILFYLYKTKKPSIIKARPESVNTQVPHPQKDKIFKLKTKLASKFFSRNTESKIIYQQGKMHSFKTKELISLTRTTNTNNLKKTNQTLPSLTE